MKRVGAKVWMKGMVFAIVLCLCSTAFAAIPRYSTAVRPLALTCDADFSRGLNLAIIEPIRSLNYTSAEDISKMIPMKDMVSGSDGGRVASQIFDRSISSFFNSPAVKNSDFGRNAHRVEKAMEGNVAVGGSRPNSIKHEFKFAMQPTQTRAFVQYRGLANAQLSYQAAGSTVNFEVAERVESLSSNVVYAHTVKPGDSIYSVSLRWVW
ncbi:MAG: hypothetical protein AAB250_13730 [Bdellovibrionota bacterium]